MSFQWRNWRVKICQSIDSCGRIILDFHWQSWRHATWSLIRLDAYQAMCTSSSERPQAKTLINKWSSHSQDGAPAEVGFRQNGVGFCRFSVIESCWGSQGRWFLFGFPIQRFGVHSLRFWGLRNQIPRSDTPNCLPVHADFDLEGRRSVSVLRPLSHLNHLKPAQVISPSFQLMLS